MDRRDRERYGHNNYGSDYSGYRDYDRYDAQYHSSSNLTNLFERDYQRHRGYEGDDRDLYRHDHTYHEGNRGDLYEQRRREESRYRGFRDEERTDWNGNHYESGYVNRERGRNRNDGIDYRGNEYREDQERFGRDRDRGQASGGTRREGYLRAYDTDPYGRRDTSHSRYNMGGGYGQNYNTGFVNHDRASRYSDSDYIGGMGTRARDDRSIPGRRSYLQTRYY